jgi:hypothetical protein
MCLGWPTKSNCVVVVHPVCVAPCRGRRYRVYFDGRLHTDLLAHMLCPVILSRTDETGFPVAPASRFD